MAVAAVFAGAGILLTFSGMQHVSGQSGFVEIAAGGCLCFVAVLALGPLIVPGVVAFLGWLPGRLAGPVARLATANARRNPRRVAATTAALTIGLTPMTLFTVVISSAQASSNAQIQRHYPFDYVVQAGHDGQVVPAHVVSALQAAPALGLTRGQLRRMLMTEALLMTALAVVLGVGLGVTFGLAMVHAFIKSSGGQGLLSVPYAGIALYAVIGGCAALAAAVRPARRAARTSVVAAMAEI